MNEHQHKQLLSKLSQPFPREAYKTRKLGGGSTQAWYLETMTVVDRLNHVCPDGWDFQLVSITERPWGKTTKGQDKMLVTAHGRLTIPGLGSRDQAGVQEMIVGGPEDTYKGAASDALKKCATLFGVGKEMYGPDYESAANFQTVPTTPAPAHYSPEQARDAAWVEQDERPRRVTTTPAPARTAKDEYENQYEYQLGDYLLRTRPLSLIDARFQRMKGEPDPNVSELIDTRTGEIVHRFDSQDEVLTNESTYAAHHRHRSELHAWAATPREGTAAVDVPTVTATSTRETPPDDTSEQEAQERLMLDSLYLSAHYDAIQEPAKTKEVFAPVFDMCGENPHRWAHLVKQIRQRELLEKMWPSIVKRDMDVPIVADAYNARLAWLIANGDQEVVPF